MPKDAVVCRHNHFAVRVVLSVFHECRTIGPNLVKLQSIAAGAMRAPAIIEKDATVSTLRSRPAAARRARSLSGYVIERFHCRDSRDPSRGVGSCLPSRRPL